MTVKTDLEISERVAYLIKQWRVGDCSLTDPELQLCVNFLIPHVNFLRKMGEAYRFVWWDLRQVCDRFEEYQESRRRVRD